jgi:hypothetical protein
MDFDDLMLDPIYDTLGVAVVIHSPDETEDDEPLFAGTVIDKTAGVEIDENNLGVKSVVPMMAVKAKDLTAQGLQPKDLLNLNVDLNGTTWTIANHIPKPGIYGEPGGQVYYQMRKPRNA